MKQYLASLCAIVLIYLIFSLFLGAANNISTELLSNLLMVIQTSGLKNSHMHMQILGPDAGSLKVYEVNHVQEVRPLCDSHGPKP
jgi:hypothetical protein